MTALVPGHLLLSVAEPVTPGRQLLLLFSLDALRNHWRPIHRIHYDEFVDIFDRIYFFKRHPVLLTHVDENEAWSARQWQLRVFEDALCRGSYRVLVYASDVVPAEEARRMKSAHQATLYSFRISLDRSSFVGWERISAIPAVPGVLKFSEISTYSGFCFARVGDSICLVSLRLEAGEAAKQGIVDGLVAGLPSVSSISVAGGLVTFDNKSLDTVKNDLDKTGNIVLFGCRG